MYKLHKWNEYQRLNQAINELGIKFQQLLFNPSMASGKELSTDKSTLLEIC